MSSRALNCLGLVLLLIALSASPAAALDSNNLQELQSETINTLATPKGLKGSMPNENKVRRVESVRHSDSPEAAAIRRELREIEDKSQRSQTGFNSDPDFKVEYENHPWENSRRLQDGTSDGETSGDKFKPMRIRFETKALDDMRDTSNAAKIDFIKNEILPRTASFWSQALAVVPVSNRLKISSAELDNREYCGDYEFTRVPSEHISQGIEDADLILYVSGTPSSRFCSYQTREFLWAAAPFCTNPQTN